PKTTNAPAAKMVIQYAGNDRKAPATPCSLDRKITGHSTPEKTFNAIVASAGAANRAATFAANKVLVLTGSGARTSTSRLSGKAASQLSTAISPATVMVVSIKKCSNVHPVVMGKVPPPMR